MSNILRGTLNKVAFFISLALIALSIWIFIDFALPYLRDEHHTTQEYCPVHYVEKLQSFVHFDFKTNDVFAADNPISVSVYAHTWVPDVHQITLHFDGADDYFIVNLLQISPNDYESSKEFEEAWDNEFKRMSAGMLDLYKDTDIDSPTYGAFIGQTELEYSIGGQFDVGITLRKEDGDVIGYGLGDQEFVITQVILISPSEVLHTLKNNNLLSGLAWLAGALTIFAIGCSFLISLLFRQNVTVIQNSSTLYNCPINQIIDRLKRIFSNLM